MASASKTLQWLSLVGVIWLQSINGTNTTFPAYSSQLRNSLKLSQVQINNLVFASDLGKLFGFVPGLAAKYLPLWIVLVIGALLGYLGFGIQYLFIIDQLSTPEYWKVFLLTVVAGNSICWINTVCYAISIRNFPLHQQVAVGITNSYQGLSAKIYTDIVNALFSRHRRAKGFVLLNAILPLIVCVVVAPLVRSVEMETEKKNKSKAGFKMMFVITIATGIYSVIISSLGSITTRMSPSHTIIGTCVFLLAPLIVPIVEKFREQLAKDWSKNRENRVCDVAIDVHNAAPDIESGSNVKEEEEDSKSDQGIDVKEEKDSQSHQGIDVKEEKDGQSHQGIDVKEEIGVLLMLIRIDFWLYFCLYLFSATIGLVFLNTLGQIAESRGSSRTTALVSLSSSFGFFGRLMPSLLDYFFSRSKYMISRPALIASLAAPISGVFFLLLSSANLSLFIGTAIIGVCTGAITSISVSITTELFGKDNFTVNHNVVVANIALGSWAFGYMSAQLYHKEANEGGRCMGMNCYRNTFIIWGSLCALGTFLALALYARTRKFYSKRS